MIWTILGFSVAIVATFCVVTAEMFVGNPLFERSRGYIAAVFAASGVAAWFIGRFLGKKRRANQSGEGPRIFILFDLRYWGPMFVTLGVIMLFIQTVKLRSSRAAAPPAPAPPRSSPPIVVAATAPPAPKKPVVFPFVKIQGIFYRQHGSTVILNGDSYEQGDVIEGATVKTITPRMITLEKEGEERLVDF